MMLGRICLSLIFITSVANQILSWDATQQFFIKTVCDWLYQPYLPSLVANILNLLLAHVALTLVIGAVFAGLGGLFVLLGISVRFGVVLLILFLIPTTVLMHAFWLYEGAVKELQMIMFLKNLAILGGLFILASTTSKEGA